VNIEPNSLKEIYIGWRMFLCFFILCYRCW